MSFWKKLTVTQFVTCRKGKWLLCLSPLDSNKVRNGLPKIVSFIAIICNVSVLWENKSKAMTNYNSNSWTFSRLCKSDLESGFYENSNTLTCDNIEKVAHIERNGGNLGHQWVHSSNIVFKNSYQRLMISIMHYSQ